jgi:hypothetical protein
VGYNFFVETAGTGFLGVSSFRLTAYVAVLLLVGVIGWVFGTRPELTSSRIQTASADTSTADKNALTELASSTAGADLQGVTPLGASILAQAVVAYGKAAEQASSSDAGLAAVQSFGANIKPPVQYRTYAASDITTVQDSSKDRVLAYRADLRTALEPLLNNKDNELDLFGQYVDTKDTKYLNALSAASQNYKLAIANTEKVVAPSDAAAYQASMLSAMSEFSSTLDTLVNNATDPFASSALMRTYLDAQDNMVTSFNSIGKYAAQKML